MSGVSSSGLPMLFRWVRLFVSHFLAKRNLEVYTVNLAKNLEHNPRPEIRIFALRGEHYKVPAWEEFEKVIRDALMDTSKEDAAIIIRNLKDKVIGGKGLKQEAYTSNTIKNFRRIMEGQQATYFLYMHCEAVVAALLYWQTRARTASSTLTDAECKTLSEFSKVLGFVLNVKFSINVFPGLGQQHGFGFKILLPCLLGTFPSSRDGRDNSWLSSQCNPDCVARDASQSRFRFVGYPFPGPPEWPTSSFVIIPRCDSSRERASPQHQ